MVWQCKECIVQGQENSANPQLCGCGFSSNLGGSFAPGGEKWQQSWCCACALKNHFFTPRMWHQFACNGCKARGKPPDFRCDHCGMPGDEEGSSLDRCGTGFSSGDGRSFTAAKAISIKNKCCNCAYANNYFSKEMWDQFACRCCKKAGMPVRHWECSKCGVFGDNQTSDQTKCGCGFSSNNGGAFTPGDPQMSSNLCCNCASLQGHYTPQTYRKHACSGCKTRGKPIEWSCSTCGVHGDSANMRLDLCTCGVWKESSNPHSANYIPAKKCSGGADRSYCCNCAKRQLFMSDVTYGQHGCKGCQARANGTQPSFTPAPAPAPAAQASTFATQPPNTGPNTAPFGSSGPNTTPSVSTGPNAAPASIQTPQPINTGFTSAPYGNTGQSSAPVGGTAEQERFSSVADRIRQMCLQPKAAPGPIRSTFGSSGLGASPPPPLLDPHGRMHTDHGEALPSMAESAGPFGSAAPGMAPFASRDPFGQTGQFGPNGYFGPNDPFGLHGEFGPQGQFGINDPFGPSRAFGSTGLHPNMPPFPSQFGRFGFSNPNTAPFRPSGQVNTAPAQQAAPVSTIPVLDQHGVYHPEPQQANAAPMYAAGPTYTVPVQSTPIRTEPTKEETRTTTPERAWTTMPERARETGPNTAPFRPSGQVNTAPAQQAAPVSTIPVLDQHGVYHPEPQQANTAPVQTAPTTTELRKDATRTTTPERARPTTPESARESEDAEFQALVAESMKPYDATGQVPVDVWTLLAGGNKNVSGAAAAAAAPPPPAVRRTSKYYEEAL